MKLPVDPAQFLQEHEPAIQGQGGSSVLFAAVCGLVRRGLNPEQCESFLEIYFNPRCVPRWSPSELKHKIQDAFKVAKPDPRLSKMLDRPIVGTMPMPRSGAITDSEEKALKRKKWPKITRFPKPIEQCRQLARSRGIEFATQAIGSIHNMRNSPLRYCVLTRENDFSLRTRMPQRKLECWALQSADKRVVEVRRMDGEELPVRETGWSKSKSLPGSYGRVIGEQYLGRNNRNILLVEGAGDYIAACWLWWLSDPFENYVPIAILGAKKLT